MLYETNGVFLHAVKYSETSLIIKVFTELFGVKSYLLKGAYRKKSPFKASMFQPMSNLHIIGYTNSKSQLNNIKEIAVINSFSKSYSNIYKSSILLFINEMLYNALKEGEINNDLYQYIVNSLVKLEEQEDNFFNFHLTFIVDLSSYLGIQPQNNYSDVYRFFNMQEGFFDNMLKPGSTVSDETINSLFSRLLNLDYDTLSNLAISVAERRELINLLIDYYKRHISGFKEVKSHKVLETVLS